jgi:hypothetical protein
MRLLTTCEADFLLDVADDVFPLLNVVAVVLCG